MIVWIIHLTITVRTRSIWWPNVLRNLNRTIVPTLSTGHQRPPKVRSCYSDSLAVYYSQQPGVNRTITPNFHLSLASLSSYRHLLPLLYVDHSVLFRVGGPCLLIIISVHFNASCGSLNLRVNVSTSAAGWIAVGTYCCRIKAPTPQVSRRESGLCSHNATEPHPSLCIPFSLVLYYRENSDSITILTLIRHRRKLLTPNIRCGP